MRKIIHFHIRFIQSAVLIFLGLSCIPALHANAVEDIASDEEQKIYNGVYSEAIRQRELGNVDAQFELLRYALKLRPNAAEALFDMACLYNEISPQNDTLALSLYKRAIAHDPQNRYYQVALGEYYIQQNKWQDAVQQYQFIARHFAPNTDILGTLVNLYEALNNPRAAIGELDKLEIMEGKDPSIGIGKYNNYLRLNEKDSALAELENLAAAYPYDMRFQVMKGDLFFQSGDTLKAYQIYRNVLDKDPDNEQAQLSLLNYYKATRQDSLYERLTSDIAQNSALNIRTRINALQEITRYALSQTPIDSMRVLRLLDKIMEKHETETAIGEFCFLYMQSMKFGPDIQIPRLQQVLNITPSYTPARLQLLSYFLSQKKFTQAAALCEEGLKYNPDLLNYHYYNAMSLYQQDKLPEAILTIKHGIAKINDDTDPDLASDLYAALGDFLHEAGNKQAAYAAYDSALTYRSENFMCLNNYAYFLSLDGDSLEKAKEMSYRTIKEEPENATFLDTYAWILFRAKEYEQARIYMDEALKHLSNEDTASGYFEHAGDIYWFCGLKDKAIDFWKKALELDRTNRLLQKKVNNKKYLYR